MARLKIDDSRVALMSACCWLWCATDVGPAAAQKGLDVSRTKVVVEGRAWEQWTYPANFVSIGETEEDASRIVVRPRKLRGVYEIFSDTSIERRVDISGESPRIMNVDSTEKLLKGILVGYDYFVRPGASRAGSNPHLAKYLVDDDPDTFWEPDPSDPLSSWWVEVDLGRPVPVERLRLQFVDAALGDPFYNYILRLSGAQAATEAPAVKLFRREGLAFETLAPLDAPNTAQREFEFVSERQSASFEGTTQPEEERLVQQESNEDWTGKVIETIRIVVTDTRAGRAERISQEEWEALPDKRDDIVVADRGDIVYFVRDIAGREEPIPADGEASPADAWADLDDERKGRREYYRRELPRLAEVEAWGWGDNVAMNLAKGGGSVGFADPDDESRGKPEEAFDGNLSTHYEHLSQYSRDPDRGVVEIDLGADVWVDHIRLTAGVTTECPPECGSRLRGYSLRGSSGARDVSGELVWEQISSLDRLGGGTAGVCPPQAICAQQEGGFLPPYIMDPVTPARQLRFLQLVTLMNNPGSPESAYFFKVGIQEIMAFSTRAPAEVVLESDLIELPGAVTLGEVSWEAQTPGASAVEIRTRTGDQIRQVVTYYSKAGLDLGSAAAYKKSFQKGPIDTSLVTGAGWSPWSRKHTVSGQQASSPGLRKYMMVQARLLPGPDAVPALERLEVQFHTPVVRSLAAEIWPEQTRAGLLDTFAVYLAPTFIEEPDDVKTPGFDEVLVSSQPHIDLSIVEVAVGTEEELARGEPEQLFDLAHADGLASSAGSVLAVAGDGGDSLLLRFPVLVEAASADVLPQIYYRDVSPSDTDTLQVPVGTDGRILTATSYARLAEESPDQLGATRYFRISGEGEEARLEKVDADEYGELSEEEKGPIRYFRRVTAAGEQAAFNDQGDSLSASEYTRLRRGDRGWRVGRGRLVRVRLSGTVYRHGTELEVAVREGGTASPWLPADSGDATNLTPGQRLSIGVSGADEVIEDVAITPNPFTPNGDGVNDVVHIGFSVFRVQALRPVTVWIFSLDGRLVRTLPERRALAGPQTFDWNGEDDSGRLLPPGLYACQIDIEADAASEKRTHVVALVY